jgi:hypothetical protein
VPASADATLAENLGVYQRKMLTPNLLYINSRAKPGKG